MDANKSLRDRDVFLSVVIPAYNESKRICRTLDNLAGYLSGKPYASEVIVVDDGSKDATVAAAKSCAGSFQMMRILDGEPNRGKGYAVRRGMLSARGERRLFMDADGAVGMGEIDRFLETTGRGQEVVIASISHPDAKTVIEHNGWHRRFLGSASKLLVRAVAVPGIYDTQRGFKMFTRRAAEAIFPLQRIDRFGFDIELLVIARSMGLAVKELPVRWDNPAGSTVKPSDYLKTFRDLARIMGNRMAGAYSRPADVPSDGALAVEPSYV